MCASETIVFVTVVPMLAPMIIGTAFASGRGFSGDATRPTTIEVVTDELWTSVVASNPTIRATNGFSVALKNACSRSPPNSRNPSLSPRTPVRKISSRPRTSAPARNAGMPGRRAREFAESGLMAR